VHVGRCRAVLPVDILRRGGAQSGRIRPAAASRRLPPQPVEHHGLRGRAHWVGIAANIGVVRPVRAPSE